MVGYQNEINSKSVLDSTAVYIGGRVAAEKDNSSFYQSIEAILRVQS